MIFLKLAVFDFNGTIFPKETIPFLIKCWKEFNYSKYRLYKLYVILLPLLIKYRLPSLTTMSKEEMKIKFMERFATMFAGMSQSEIERYFLKVEKEARQHFNLEVISSLEDFKDGEYETVLLSGAFIQLLEVVGNRLEFDKVFGSTILNDSKQEDKSPSVLSGSQKLKVLKVNYESKDVDWENSYAYADSIDDLELLEEVGNPVAVKPDQKLLEHAQNRGWAIIN